MSEQTKISKVQLEKTLQCASEEILKLREHAYTSWLACRYMMFSNKKPTQKVLDVVKACYLASLTVAVSHVDPLEVLDEILQNTLDAEKKPRKKKSD